MFSSAAVAGPYGTIILPNGKKVVIFKSNTTGRSYVVVIGKNGRVEGGCRRESMNAYQARKAYMVAGAKFQRNYGPDNRQKNNATSDH